MIETARSRIDWAKFRELEARRHREFFLPQYESLGMSVVEDIFDDVKTNAYDVVVIGLDGVWKRIDEKARGREYGDFLVEVMQCLRTGKHGWLYKDVDIIFYASWANEEDVAPSSAYLVEAGRLKDFVIMNMDDLKSVTSEKGYGLSWNKVVAWRDLEFHGIASRVL